MRVGREQRTLVSPGNANVYAKQFNMDRWQTDALQLGEMAQYAMYIKCRAPGLVSRQRDQQTRFWIQYHVVK